jgi:K+-transporting ATPase ATPase B chain
VSITVLVALLVCLIPTTIGGLLSAIGIAGMDRMMRANVIATSGRAVEAAGDVDVLLLDKTGTITLGNRQAAALPARARRDRGGTRGRGAARVAGGRDAGRALDRRARQAEASTARSRHARADGAQFVQVHRADAHERRRPGRAASIRKGAADAVRALRRGQGGTWPRPVRKRWTDIARRGATPLSSRRRTRARRRRAEGRRQGRHQGALHASCGAWASRPS